MDLYLLNIGEKIEIKEEILSYLVDFISNRDAIDYYCTRCNRIKTFIQKNSENVVVVESIKDGSYKALNMYHLKMKDDKMIYDDSDWLGHEISYTFYKTLENFYIFKTFKCPTCNNSIVMISYYHDNCITKIYQSYISDIMSDQDIVRYQQFKLLSEGIHKLDETICEKLFYVIYDSVVMILEKESERKKAEKRIKDVNKNFNEIFKK